MKRLITLLFSLTMASPLTAHPHIFIDTGLDLHFDGAGRLTQVKVIWEYDEFYSLLITEDRGYDSDFDGVLTAAELRDLQGFDMQWTPGFNGDLVIEQDGRALTLSGPQQATATYENGRITTTHVRQVSVDQRAAVPLEIKPFDPTYYSAYDVTRPVRILGTAGCQTQFQVPDIDARLVELRDALAALDAMTTADDAGLPNVGGLLATTVRVTCDIS